MFTLSHYTINTFITKERGLCYVKGHELVGTAELSVFIEKKLNSAGGGCVMGVSVCGVTACVCIISALHCLNCKCLWVF